MNFIDDFLQTDFGNLNKQKLAQNGNVSTNLIISQFLEKEFLFVEAN